MQTEVTVYGLEWVNRLAHLIIAILVGASFTMVMIAILGLGPRDATDGPDKRSGLRLNIDYGTGCEYLSTSGGGITPRMTGDGKHKGCR